MRLPRPRDPVMGDLRLEAFSHGNETWLRAQLLDERRELLAPLHRAKVLKVTRHGMVIGGIEMVPHSPGSKSRTSQHRQTWWAMVWTEQALKELPRDDPMDEDVRVGGGVLGY